MLLWIFIGRCLGFALRGSTKHINAWQVIWTGAAPALLAAGVLSRSGVPVPQSEIAQYAAYLGYGFAAWIALRFFVGAPYALWREQYDTVGKLRIELSKPERIELARMGRIRGKKRIQLAAELRQLHWLSNRSGVESMSSFTKSYKRMYRLMSEAAVSEGYRRMYELFQTQCDNIRLEKGLGPGDAKDRSKRLMTDMEEYLHGKLNDEGLALRLANYG